MSETKKKAKKESAVNMFTDFARHEHLWEVYSISDYYGRVFQRAEVCACGAMR